MRLLLDTHVALWVWAAPEKLSATALGTLQDPANPVWVSAASAYEIALKINLGKLPPLPLPFEAMAAQAGFEVLAITSAHAAAAGALPLDHRDPWDRLIAAQARLEALELMSADNLIARLGVPVIW